VQLDDDLLDAAAVGTLVVRGEHALAAGAALPHAHAPSMPPRHSRTKTVTESIHGSRDFAEYRAAVDAALSQ
jgi:hypothetical protein